MAFSIENKFNPGDVVSLMSGGPLMTVIDTDGDHTHVAWFIDDAVFKEAVIHQNALFKH